jgi:PIN domain nuclease of toxin-antitoxin system
VRFLLDTHTLIWWPQDEGPKLSNEQSRSLSELERDSEPAAISAITLWEIAMLRERGRLGSMKSLAELLRQVESHPLVTVIPLNGSIAAESVRWGEGFHSDPTDQIVVATARCHDLTLVTADARIRKCKVRVV